MFNKNIFHFSFKNKFNKNVLSFKIKNMQLVIFLKNFNHVLYFLCPLVIVLNSTKCSVEHSLRNAGIDKLNSYKRKYGYRIFFICALQYGAVSLLLLLLLLRVSRRLLDSKISVLIFTTFFRLENIILFG